ncbi:ATP-binding cassette domain-containing protein [Planococcus shixiaomingii]|uniref:ATP-binding cassette domain-containing protein n=1 Tax=Planococcus shixiaomingii TaxID=3058393 RepID=UPI0026211A7D|nr:ABC transporter ATP-binding protein [Planococcus sp. N022]WKA56568.1 ABC transporter ATP-binding protein [Planococcus sp. N022]
MLAVNDIHLKTKETLLYGATMQLEKGTIYGLSARNGSGKTTLLRTISGLRSEPLGSISIQENGQPLSALEVKKQLFYFETVEWFDPNLSGWDYLRFTQATWNQSDQPIDEIVSFWEMDSYIKTPIKKYSLGMKQKVLLAMYGVSGASYWLLDEPTIGLDTNSLKKFEAYLLEAKQDGACILFSSHQNDSLYAVCDYMYEMENGSLLLSTMKKGEE